MRQGLRCQPNTADGVECNPRAQRSTWGRPQNRGTASCEEGQAGMKKASDTIATWGRGMGRLVLPAPRSVRPWGPQSMMPLLWHEAPHFCTH